jgi:hypothetical protein
VCALVAIGAPALELVPFSASFAGAVFTVFGLSIVSRDGVLALLGFASSAAVFGLAVAKLLDCSRLGRCAEKPKALTAESARCSCPRIRLQHIPRICETAPDSAGLSANRHGVGVKKQAD